MNLLQNMLFLPWWFMATSPTSPNPFIPLFYLHNLVNKCFIKKAQSTSLLLPCVACRCHSWSMGNDFSRQSSRCYGPLESVYVGNRLWMNLILRVLSMRRCRCSWVESMDGYSAFRSPFSLRYKWGSQAMCHNFSEAKKVVTWRKLWVWLARSEKVSC